MAPTPQPSTAIATLNDTHEALIDRLERGERPADIAKKIHPDDRKARKTLRSRLREMLYHDSKLQESIVGRARFNMMAGLPEASAALARRAGRGNVPAIKLVYEATGLHNPRVQHEHSGDITIHMDIPRPTFTQDVDSTAVEDAEVVE